MNGFQLLTKIFSEGATSEVILDHLLTMIFWRRVKRTGMSKHCQRVQGSTSKLKKRNKKNYDRLQSDESIRQDLTSSKSDSEQEKMNTKKGSSNKNHEVSSEEVVIETQETGDVSPAPQGITEELPQAILKTSEPLRSTSNSPASRTGNSVFDSHDTCDDHGLMKEVQVDEEMETETCVSDESPVLTVSITPVDNIVPALKRPPLPHGAGTNKKSDRVESHNEKEREIGNDKEVNEVASSYPRQLHSPSLPLPIKKKDKSSLLSLSIFSWKKENRSSKDPKDRERDKDSDTSSLHSGKPSPQLQPMDSSLDFDIPPLNLSSTVTKLSLKKMDRSIGRVEEEEEDSIDNGPIHDDNKDDEGGDDYSDEEDEENHEEGEVNDEREVAWLPSYGGRWEGSADEVETIHIPQALSVLFATLPLVPSYSLEAAQISVRAVERAIAFSSSENSSLPLSSKAGNSSTLMYSRKFPENLDVVGFIKQEKGDVINDESGIHTARSAKSVEGNSLTARSAKSLDFEEMYQNMAAEYLNSDISTIVETLKEKGKSEKSGKRKSYHKDKEGNNKDKSSSGEAAGGSTISASNASLIYDQKDWLPWLSDCILHHKEKTNNEYMLQQQQYLNNSRSFFPDNESLLEESNLEKDPVYRRKNSDSSNPSRSRATTGSSSHGMSRGHNTPRYEDENDDEEVVLFRSSSKESFKKGGSLIIGREGLTDDELYRGNYNQQQLRQLQEERESQLRWQADQVQKLRLSFSTPLLSLIHKLLVRDMRMNPTGARAWQSLLFLPLTNLLAHEVQVVILYDLLEVFERYPIGSIEVVLNIFKNMANLLSQLLLKCDISLEFCVKTIQSIHALSYKCPPNIRSRIQETKLPNVRNAYVYRVITQASTHRDAGLPGQVNALQSIQSSLTRYVTTTKTEIKELSDKNVLVLLLDMFLEASSKYQTHMDVYYQLLSTALPDKNSTIVEGTGPNTSSRSHNIIDQINFDTFDGDDNGDVFENDVRGEIHGEIASDQISSIFNSMGHNSPPLKRTSSDTPTRSKDIFFLSSSPDSLKKRSSSNVEDVYDTTEPTSTSTNTNTPSVGVGPATTTTISSTILRSPFTFRRSASPASITNAMTFNSAIVTSNRLSSPRKDSPGVTTTTISPLHQRSLTTSPSVNDKDKAEKQPSRRLSGRLAAGILATLSGSNFSNPMGTASGVGGVLEGDSQYPNLPPSPPPTAQIPTTIMVNNIIVSSRPRNPYDDGNAPWTSTMDSTEYPSSINYQGSVDKDSDTSNHSKSSRSYDKHEISDADDDVKNLTTDPTIVFNLANTQRNIMIDILFIVQNCIGVASFDCRKFVTTILQTLPGDDYSLMVSAFILSYRYPNSLPNMHSMSSNSNVHGGVATTVPPLHMAALGTSYQGLSNQHPILSNSGVISNIGEKTNEKGDKGSWWGGLWNSTSNSSNTKGTLLPSNILADEDMESGTSPTSSQNGRSNNNNQSVLEKEMSNSLAGVPISDESIDNSGKNSNEVKDMSNTRFSSDVNLLLNSYNSTIAEPNSGNHQGCDDSTKLRTLVDNVVDSSETKTGSIIFPNQNLMSQNNVPANDITSSDDELCATANYGTYYARLDNAHLNSINEVNPDIPSSTLISISSAQNGIKNNNSDFDNKTVTAAVNHIFIRPTNNASFIDWFCNRDNLVLRQTLRIRVDKELKPLTKRLEKAQVFSN